MELRTYFNIVWQERAIVVLCTIAALIAAYVFTIRQPVIYDATATFVMRPRASLVEDQQDSVRVLDTLGRQVSIGSTYIQVASSRLIRQRAGESLGLSGSERSNLKVNGEVVAGTNILKITVEGSDPTVIHAFANQIGVETVKYVSNLYEIFELEPLDEARPPQRPIGPVLMLNLVLGGVLGVMLGTGIALLSYYLRTPQKKMHHLDIIDHETDVYTLAYFRLRLHQEVSRARRKGEQFSVALVRLPKLQAASGKDVLPQTAAVLQAWLRNEDLVAYAGEWTFAILLVDTSGEAAKDLVERLCMHVQTEVLAHANGLKLWNAKCTAGISTLSETIADADELWSQSVDALTDSKMTRQGKVNLYSQPESVLMSSSPLP